MSLNDSNDIKNTAATHPVLKLQPGRGYKFIMLQLSLFLSKHHKKPSTDEQVYRKVIGSGDLCVYTGSFYYAFKESLIRSHAIIASKEMCHIFLAEIYRICWQRDIPHLRRRRALPSSQKQIIASWGNKMHLMAVALFVTKPGECSAALLCTQIHQYPYSHTLANTQYCPRADKAEIDSVGALILIWGLHPLLQLKKWKDSKCQGMQFQKYLIIPAKKGQGYNKHSCNTAPVAADSGSLTSQSPQRTLAFGDPMSWLLEHQHS